MAHQDENFPQEAMERVVEAWNETADENLSPLHIEDVFVVWFSYILGNWKALVSTNRYQGYYWEVTYRDATDEVYVDTYVKSGQVVLTEDDEDKGE